MGIKKNEVNSKQADAITNETNSAVLLTQENNLLRMKIELLIDMISEVYSEFGLVERNIKPK